MIFNNTSCHSILFIIITRESKLPVLSHNDNRPNRTPLSSITITNNNNKSNNKNNNYFLLRVTFKSVNYTNIIAVIIIAIQVQNTFVKK